jgi:hypothetical protein
MERVGRDIVCGDKEWAQTNLTQEYRVMTGNFYVGINSKHRYTFCKNADKSQTHLMRD